MSVLQTASSDLISRRDLAFLLYEWLDVEGLCSRLRFSDQSRAIFDDVLDLAERVAAEQFAPHNRRADIDEPHLDEEGRVVLVPEVEKALRAYAEVGLTGTAMDESVGGMQLPQVVADAALAFFYAANVGTASYSMLTKGATNLLLAKGSLEQVETWGRPMVDGRFFGTMCLSEPQAGSSLADVTTRAERQEDGTYRLFGTKMWISGGEHELGENIVHMVLARTPGGPLGVKGISLFIVPRFLLDDDGQIAERNDVVLAGLNHKMGSRGTVNTVLGFGEGAYKPGGHAGAVGYLVGEPHHGLAYMFHMMNEARIAVGLAAACLGYTGYLKALRYASERPQGRPLGDRDGAAHQVPILAHADVRRMLLAQKSYVEGALALTLYCARLLDDEQTSPLPQERAEARVLLDVLTPIAKSWPAQWCLAANDLAIQVHGGYGYAREYDVEQHYRDNRLNAIHEGTHGIQALDLLRRKVRLEDGAGLGILDARISATVQRATAEGGAAAEYGQSLEDALRRLLDVTAALVRHPDVEVGLANASIYLEAAGHTVVAWLWLDQLLAAGSSEDAFFAGKRQAAKYFFRYELPKIGPQLDLLGSLDTTTIEMQDAWF